MFKHLGRCLAFLTLNFNYTFESIWMRCRKWRLVVYKKLMLSLLILRFCWYIWWQYCFFVTQSFLWFDIWHYVAFIEKVKEKNNHKRNAHTKSVASYLFHFDSVISISFDQFPGSFITFHSAFTYAVSNWVDNLFFQIVITQ